MIAPGHGPGVFLNCPFDRGYRPLMQGIVFAVSDAGLTPRSALEMDDSAENRLDKIFRIIGECPYGIHDISRTEPDAVHSLPRFNMPLELGIYLGCRRFGGLDHAAKNCLVLDRDRYRYQKFISDLAGIDIHAHDGDPKTAVREVRAWVRTATGRTRIPGGEEIWRRYLSFQKDLAIIAWATRIPAAEMTFAEYCGAVHDWLRNNPF